MEVDENDINAGEDAEKEIEEEDAPDDADALLMETLCQAQEEFSSLVSLVAPASTEEGLLLSVSGLKPPDMTFASVEVSCVFSHCSVSFL